MAILLAVETSCDETAVAVLEGFGNLLGSAIWSQAEIHSEYGGVVPEVASRNHVAALPGLVRSVLRQGALSLDEVDAIAATTGPGLPAALLVGAAAAKGMALGAGKPFLAINHMEGHLLSPFFGEPRVEPHVGLVVSGGHTMLVDVGGFGDYRVLGSTLDDAAGEAFDKVAKLMGLGYPGGVEIDRLARDGNRTAIDFPRSMLHSGDYKFSFSGLKTAVRYLLEKESPRIEDVCASFQEAVIDVLIEKAMRAVREMGRDVLAVSGGVSSNSRLQELACKRCAREGVRVRFAAPQLRTDNAAMIAYVAAHRFAAGRMSPLDTDVQPAFAAASF